MQLDDAPTIDQRRGLGPAAGRAYLLAQPDHLACGLYHLVSPACTWAAASSGASLPLMTPALTLQSSFSRLGSPRERIWYEFRIVDLHRPRQLRNVWARGSFSVTF